jgi:hypothetical protein
MSGGDVMGVLGLLVFGYGIYLLSVPAVVIFAGVVLLAAAYELERPRTAGRRRTDEDTGI